MFKATHAAKLMIFPFYCQDQLKFCFFGIVWAGRGGGLSGELSGDFTFTNPELDKVGIVVALTFCISETRNS